MHSPPERDPMLGIIYNPLSKKGKNRHRVEDVRKILDEKGFQYEYRETECPMDGIRVAREMSETCDTLIAVGGDGTLNEVINGGIDKDVTIGVLPFGSGNDVSRSLHVFEKSDEELADMIMNPKVRDLDTGLYNGRTFSMFISFGIVTTIIQNYIRMKGAGRTAYPRAVLKAVMHHKPKQYHIKLPDREWDCNADFLAVMSVPTGGGGLYLDKDGIDNDGQFELVIINHQTRRRLFANALALFKGKLNQQKNVDNIPVTDWIEITLPEDKMIGTMDGELLDFDKDVRLTMSKKIKVLY